MKKSMRFGTLLLSAGLIVALPSAGEKKKFTPETLFPSNDFNHMVISEGVEEVVFVSAQGAAQPGETMIDNGLTLQEQTKRALRNLGAALEAAGATPDDVIRIHIYVTAYQQVEGTIVGRQVRRFFNNRMPTSSFIPVAALVPSNARVQIDAEAELESK